jgi:hypothetical protein
MPESAFGNTAAAARLAHIINKERVPLLVEYVWRGKGKGRARCLFLDPRQILYEAHVPGAHLKGGYLTDLHALWHNIAQNKLQHGG